MTAVATPVQVAIRPFTPEDYPILAAIGNACFPEYADPPEVLQHYDTSREAYIKWNHYIAEYDGKAVGLASYYQRESMYHPQKFEIEVTVHPEFQGQGIGTQLYAHLRQELAVHDPILLRAHAQEGRMRGPEFATRLGFVEGMRDWESRLQLADFDPTTYKDAVQRVLDQGIVIKSLAELTADPDRDRKLYEMDWIVTLGMPATEVRTKPSFESFCRKRLEDPDFLPEGWFIALDGDAYIGESAIHSSQMSDGLFVGSTGVLPEYRRRGIATALKVYATAFAKNRGATELKTWNAQSNRAMLSINEAMGFVKQPAWISYELRLTQEDNN